MYCKIINCLLANSVHSKKTLLVVVVDFIPEEGKCGDEEMNFNMRKEHVAVIACKEVVSLFMGI